MAYNDFYLSINYGRPYFIKERDLIDGNIVTKVNRAVMNFMEQEGFIEHWHEKDAEGGWPYNDYAPIPFKISEKGKEYITEWLKKSE